MMDLVDLRAFVGIVELRRVSAAARAVRVRGDAKVMCHLMLGILSIAAVQILRLVT